MYRFLQNNINATFETFGVPEPRARLFPKDSYGMSQFLKASYAEKSGKQLSGQSMPVNAEAQGEWKQALLWML